VVCAADCNLLSEKRDIIRKNTQVLLDASEEVCLGVKVEKTERVLVSRHQIAAQNQCTKTADK
jgi:hypothetical protein